MYNCKRCTADTACGSEPRSLVAQHTHSRAPFRGKKE
jgi:hypothetical protein